MGSGGELLKGYRRGTVIFAGFDPTPAGLLMFAVPEESWCGARFASAARR
jgi:hypothetical protein